MTLRKVAYIPGLGYNLLSASMASKKTGMIARLWPNKVILAEGDSAYKLHLKGWEV